MNAFYEETGAGYPLVLLHAFPLSRRMWEPQIAPLTNAGLRVITVDLPGFGANRNFENCDSVRGMADFVLATLDKIGLEKCHLGGLSMGGYVIFEMLRAARERFSGLILCDTTDAADSTEKKQGRRALIERIENEGTAALVEQMLPNLVAERTRRSDPQLYERLAEEFRAVDPRAAVNALRALAARRDNGDLLATIDVPTLLVFGEHDAVTGLEQARRMERRIAGAELRIIEDAGHYSNLEQPLRFGRALAEFCRRTISQ